MSQACRQHSDTHLSRKWKRDCQIRRAKLVEGLPDHDRPALQREAGHDCGNNNVRPAGTSSKDTQSRRQNGQVGEHVPVVGWLIVGLSTAAGLGAATAELWRRLRHA